MNKGLTLSMASDNVKRYMRHSSSTSAPVASTQADHHPPAAPRGGAEAYHVFANKKDYCIKCVLIPPQAPRNRRER